MKKFMALLLSMMLVLGLMPSAMAANANSVVIAVTTASTGYSAGPLGFKVYASYQNDLETLSINVDEENKKVTYTTSDNTIKNYSNHVMRDISPALTNGVLEISQIISFTKPDKSVLVPTSYGKSPAASRTEPLKASTHWIMKDGLFFDNETACVANTEYVFTTTLNTDTNVLTYRVVNAELGVDASKDYQYPADNALTNLDCVWYINWMFDSTEPSSFSTRDFTVTMTAGFPTIERIAYVENGEETAVADSELVSNNAQSVKAIFSGYIAKGLNYTGNIAKLYKVNGATETEVAITESFSNSSYDTGYEPYVTVTPAAGFEPGATYKLHVSNVRDNLFDSVMPESGLVKTFTVADSLGFRGIKDGDVINSSSVSLSAYTPNPASGVKFVLDGVELAAPTAEGNIFTTSVSGLAYGYHRLTVISGEESKTITFTSVNSTKDQDVMAATEPTYLTVTPCTGADGTENGAINLTLTQSASSDGYLLLRHGTMNYTDNRSIWFEADVRRVGGNVGLQVYGRTAAAGFPVVTGGDLIKRSPDGGVASSSYRIAQDDAQWHNVRVIQQMKAGMAKYLVYLDNELVDINDVDWTSLSTTSLPMSRIAVTRYSGGSLQMDNAKFGEIVSPVFVSAGYKVDAAAESFTEAVDGVISGASKVIKITQLNNPLTLEGVAVTVNGVAATAVIDSQDSNSLIITPADGSIKANEDVVIKVGNYVTVLKANGDMLDNIGAVKAEFVGNGAKAKVTITKGNLGESTLDTITLVVASYDGNKLKAIDLRQITLKSGPDTYEAVIENLNGGTRVRAMLWEPLSVLSPIGAFDEISVTPAE